MKHMLSRQKAMKEKMGIMFGNLKNPAKLGIKHFYVFNNTTFYVVTCGPLHARSKCPQSNIQHFIVGRRYINCFITEADLIDI